MATENPWSTAIPVPGAESDGREPALAFIGQTLHLVWNRSKTLTHVSFDGKAWLAPVRVAAGEQPVLAAGIDGTLHCVFAHRFIGNYEIYHTVWQGSRWSLPTPLSRTPGISVNPALAVGPDGTLHAAWADSTPGYSTIYYGTYKAPFWTSAPIPSGRGTLPTIAVASDGAVHVAWQDRLDASARYEVLSSVSGDGRWSVPQIVSDSSTAHSVQPQLLADGRGACHLVWQEEAGNVYHVRYARRTESGWQSPVDLTPYSDDCRLPFIARNKQSFLQLVWLEGAYLRHRVRPAGDETDWWPPETAPNDIGELRDLSMVIAPTGETHAIQSGYTASGASQLLYSVRRPVLRPVSAL